MSDGFSSSKFVPAIDPAAGTGAPGVVEVDGAGYQYAVFVVTLGTIGAGGGSTVKVQESATSGGSFADVAGTSVVIGDTDDDSTKVIAVNLAGRERYLKMAATTPAASTAMAAVCVLTNGINTSNYASAPDAVV